MNDIFELHKIAGFSEDEAKNLNPNFNKIEMSKAYSKVAKKAAKDIKDENCYICKKKCESFCNSHSIPSMILSNIAYNGEVYYSNAVLNFCFVKEKVGVRKAGTFKIICRDCDSKMFQDYEDEEMLLSEINNKMLSEIALKDFLNEVYEKRLRISEFSNYSNYSQYAHSQIKPSVLDEQEAEESIKYALKSIEDKNAGYYLFYQKELDYTVPIAFQNQIVLISDLEGKMVNNIYNYDFSYKMKSLFLCVFPLKNKTLILMFLENNDKRNSSFRKQFLKLSEAEQLEVINYIIFLYSDEFFISPKIDEKVLKNESLKEVCSLTSTYSVSTFDPMNIEQKNPIKLAVEKFDLSKRISIPNFLSKDLCIN